MPVSGPLRLAEATGVLSLATDLAMGQPLEHGLRTAVLGVRTAAALGLPEQDLTAVFYTGMLHFAGCTAGSEIDARFLGDELAVRPQLMAALYGSRFGLVATAARAAHPGRPPAARAAAMARSAVGGLAEFRRWAASHCEVAELLGARMGLTEQVQAALRHLYERWDGKGLPGDLRGEQVPLPVRVMQVAQDADIAWQRGGPALARRTVRGRAGSGLDPQVAAVLLSLGDQVYAGLDAPSVWEEALAAEPGPQPVIGEDQMDACLSAMADFADLKSMWTIGHSRGVADLAGAAAGAAGLGAAEAAQLRRAALVHDIGRVAVPARVWAKPGPLTRGEREQVRLHAYHSERVLDIAPGLRPLARLAGGTASAATGRAITAAAGPVTCRLWRGCWPPRTATRRCGSRGRTGPRCRRPTRPMSCAARRRPAGSRRTL